MLIVFQLDITTACVYVAVEANDPVIMNNNRRLYKITCWEVCILAGHYS
jgi:hypothetical protein